MRPPTTRRRARWARRYGGVLGYRRGPCRRTSSRRRSSSATTISSRPRCRCRGLRPGVARRPGHPQPRRRPRGVGQRSRPDPRGRHPTAVPAPHHRGHDHRRRHLDRAVAVRRAGPDRGAVLASSAIAAAVVGFAARQVLANAIAGLQIAITQPVRVGDQVTFEGEKGTVEDLRLTYTWLRTGTDARVIIPNERLAAGVLRNDSILRPTSRWRPRCGSGPRPTRPRAPGGPRRPPGGARAHRRIPPARAPPDLEAGPPLTGTRPARGRSPARGVAGAAEGRVRGRTNAADGEFHRERGAAGTRRNLATLPLSPCPAANDSGGAAEQGRPRAHPLPGLRVSDRLRHRRHLRGRVGRERRVLRTVARRLKPASPGANSVVYAADGRPGWASSSRRSCASRSRRPRSRRSCTTRRSRSRTGASTSTRASTSRASSARRSRTSGRGKTVQGGSTLTMQLIRNLYTRGPRRATQAQDPRGEARGAARGQAHGPGKMDPHGVPEHGP